MYHRRAVSLVELLVVMSACTVLLSISASLIHRAMHAESRSRSFYSVERNALRLSQQFRHDVHQAISATVIETLSDADAFLRLTTSEAETLEYRRRDGVVLRAIMQDGKDLSRETYAFPASSRHVIREVGHPRRLVLTITADPKEMPEAGGMQPWNQFATRVAFQAEAILARDFRFAPATPPREVLP